MKKVLAIILTIFIAFGWFVTLRGVGSFAPLGEQLKLGLDLIGGVSVVMEAETDLTGAELRALMNQTQSVIEKRVNEFGLSEPVVTIEGEKRIRVELPGADDADSAIAQIGRTAQLLFLTADGAVVMDGSHIRNATAEMNQDSTDLLNVGTYVVSLEMTSEGATRFEEATRAAYNREVTPMEGFDANQVIIMLDDMVLSAPGVRNGAISGGRAQITGGFGRDEAVELAALIRGGALPVALMEVETEIVGPTLGIDALNGSILAGIIGIVLIFILMIGLYRIMGLTANLALLLYVLIILWVMALLGAVMTLPGIAGIILGIGMAVDANVIIFSRIKEEVINGKSIRVAAHEGFRRAMATIVDSQITTLIAGVVLYQIGSGPVRGFATTLMIGIVASVFTAVIVTQLYLTIFAESKTFGTKTFFAIPEPKEKNRISFMNYRKIYYAVSAGLIILGLVVGMVRGFNFGIDFTGGTMIKFDMGREVAVSEIRDVLDESGVSAEIQHAGEGNTQVIIKTVQALDNDTRNQLYGNFFETFDLDQSSILNASLIGPSVGEGLKRNAILAVVIAAACMLIYIAFRFEWKLGVASIIALIHDVLMMIAFYGLFNVPINTPFISGILIVVGYSINDTIVMFDRIRENNRLMAKSKKDVLINTSINQTMGRSIMTTVTTILAIVPLYILGGDTIREFTMPLIIGMLAGVVSSITIASSVYYDISNLVKKPKYQGK